jgi:hypothetical protein
MSAIALKTSTAAVVPSVTNSDVQLEIVESIEQLTLPVGAAVKAGAAVRIDTNGKFVECDGTTAGNADAYGIATHRCGAAGEALTAIAKGVLGGFDFTAQAFWSDVFISDTVGVLADAAGTSSKKVGKVIPVHSQLRGGTPMKVLQVRL